ncbi:hypothetical protein Sme01_49800 [Sphaerisporangium melleum]|uniref:FHA domain-containing protein n=1 Tax=Sphaerisporangium melleum TaxID=321316 RepID=A0A917R4V7_9ACTN|nr:FHA domain-containing protein [Sphaerisporangium melleum]GGK89478.1 hypothetical protein GCM10007964_35200 [Sphaerisporangium melleum]GII72504.1 hypothetical protein Sme01_49800 [Sphaerisporangium melleum]
MAICPVGHESADEEYCDICGARMTGSPAPGPHPGGASPSAGGPAPGEGSGGGAQVCPDCGADRDGRFCETCGYDFVLGGARPALAAAPPPAAPPSTPNGPAAPWQPAQPTGNATPAPPWRPAQPVQQGRPSGQNAWQPSRPVQPAGWPAGEGAPQPSGSARTGWVAVISADRAHYDTMIGQGGPDAARVAFPPYCPERRVPLSGPEMRIGRHSQSRSLVPEIDLSGPPEDPGVSHLHAVLLAQPDGSWELVDPGSANGTLVNGDLLEVNVPVPIADGDRVHVGAWTLITVRRS